MINGKIIQDCQYTYLYYDTPYQACSNINIEYYHIEDEYLAKMNNAYKMFCTYFLDIRFIFSHCIYWKYIFL